MLGATALYSIPTHCGQSLTLSSAVARATIPARRSRPARGRILRLLSGRGISALRHSDRETPRTPAVHPPCSTLALSL